MKKIKEKLGKILILLCACLSIGAVVNAKETTATDVEIAIEATMPAEPAASDVDTKITKQKMETIKTGDDMAWMNYAVAFSLTIAVVIGCIRKKKKGMVVVFALFISMFLMDSSVMAADKTENVNVTIPTNISILFDESGQNSISEFDVNNQSLVPIAIDKIHVTECNKWRLATKGQEIPVNAKSLVFEMEDQVLVAGENLVNIPIAEQARETMDIHVERGAWTTSSTKEKALELEFEYTIGKKEFELKFDTNGSTETVAAKRAYNGDSVELPILEREGYKLAGWEDVEGNLYTDWFVMPIGDVTLKARWKEELAYAIYSANDTSLRFVRSADPIQVGDTYNGIVVTDVFTGFEEDVYASEYEVPWYDGNYYINRVISKIIFEDVIRPKSTAYWFCWAYDCAVMDMRKLDMSNVTDMSYMCAWASSDAKIFTITGINDWDVSNVRNMEFAFAYVGYYTPSLLLNLGEWDVSKVTNMNSTFKGTGYFSKTFSLGDLGKWDVSNVTDMEHLFMQTGFEAPWSLDLSKWDVRRVTNCFGFKTAVETKIMSPNWVN